MTVLGDSLQHENYFSQTRIAFLRREILLEKYTRNIVKSRKTRNTTEKSNSRSHRQRMCISLVILLRELLPTETRFVQFSPRISQISSNHRRELFNSRGESRQLGSVQLYVGWGKTFWGIGRVPSRKRA